MRQIEPDIAYEVKAVGLLALGFGLVGLDRWLVTPLAPQIMRELKFNYQDLGALAAAIGLSWGVFAIVMGRLADRIGRRVIIIPAVIGFSLLSGLSGLATGFTTLFLARLAMGVAEGAYCPSSYAAALDASPPKRRGLNLGIISSAFALFGLALGPIIATQLVLILPSWRDVFLLVAVPGLILAFFLSRVLRETPVAAQHVEQHGPSAGWLAVLHYRNICVVLPVICCSMSGVFVLGVMAPLFLTDVVHLPTATMGMVMSGLGFGGFAGQIAVGAVSDRLGRKLSLAAAFVTGAAALLLLAFAGFCSIGLFFALFVAAFACCGANALLAGPIPGESVAADMASSAMGLAIGVGEIFGGGIAPAIGGYIAQHAGLEATLAVVAGVLLIGAVMTALLTETAPRFQHR
ncbi:MFS transporter [Novosphingobium humi]|uniref:MFS transporter n=1 Tax=Novosphingobium humi TaxID=2282397 RepID=A0ABY7U4E2_9SPHN|nr:MFS transporter [Novosphingobium humi]WCT79244.1 MFS transporter [Novosphingobium humi]